MPGAFGQRIIDRRHRVLLEHLARTECRQAAQRLQATQQLHLDLVELLTVFGWQISSFYDLNETDQAIYNALVTASEELWWIHGGRLTFPQPDQEPWPTVAELAEDYELPPFVKDLAWEQQGRVEWQRIAEFSFEGSTVYYGGGGQVPGQSAYLLVLSHVHKGASYADGATMWVHSDPNAPPPDTIKTDSLIVNGWREIIPYLGSTEVERLRGTRR